MFMSFKRSKDILLALSFFLVTALIIFSTLMFVAHSLWFRCTNTPPSYFAERGVWDEVLHTFVDVNGDPSQIEVRPLPLAPYIGLIHLQSIPAAAWFVLVTITTVGYVFTAYTPYA